MTTQRRLCRKAKASFFKSFLKDHDLSQRELAAACEVSQACISRGVRGQSLKAETFYKIAAKMSELLGKEVKPCQLYNGVSSSGQTSTSRPDKPPKTRKPRVARSATEEPTRYCLITMNDTGHASSESRVLYGRLLAKSGDTLVLHVEEEEA